MRENGGQTKGDVAMKELDALIGRVETAETAAPAWVREALVKAEAEVLRLVKGQLWDGKAADGGDLRPSYSQDPYFKTPEQSVRYRLWKQEITPNPSRDPDTPNLFIAGRFYNELGVDYSTEAMTVQGATSYAGEIVAKYGLKSFGLSDAHLAYVSDVFVKPHFQQRLKEHLTWR